MIIILDGKKMRITKVKKMGTAITRVYTIDDIPIFNVYEHAQ